MIRSSSILLVIIVGIVLCGCAGTKINQKLLEAPTGEKKNEPAANVSSQEDSKQLCTFNLTNMRLLSLMIYIAQKEKVMILREDNHIGNNIIDYVPSEFQVPTNKVNTVIYNIIESTLRNKGYVIVKNGNIWSVVKKERAAEFEVKNPESDLSCQADKKDDSKEETTITITDLKIGPLLEYISKREGVPILCEDNTIKEVVINYIPGAFQMPANKYDSTMDSIVETILKMRGYKLVKGDKVWEVVKIDKASRKVVKPPIIEEIFETPPADKTIKAKEK